MLIMLARRGRRTCSSTCHSMSFVVAVVSRHTFVLSLTVIKIVGSVAIRMEANSNVYEFEQMIFGSKPSSN